MRADLQMRVGSVCHRDFSRRQLIWRASGTNSIVRKYPERTDIRHAVSWCGPAHRRSMAATAPTCGCRWDYERDPTTYVDEVLLPHVHLFRGAVGDKFVFMDDNATCHRTLAV
ncbi:hypothetical protein TNCV_1635461, partial [Trichonephila clavipes]